MLGSVDVVLLDGDVSKVVELVSDVSEVVVGNSVVEEVSSEDTEVVVDSASNEVEPD